jgi:hypothetical protein
MLLSLKLGGGLQLCAPGLFSAGDIDGVAYLQKYTTLEHIHADQVDKLTSDIIYRRLVEVRHAETPSLSCNHLL